MAETTIASVLSNAGWINVAPGYWKDPETGAVFYAHKALEIQQARVAKDQGPS